MPGQATGAAARVRRALATALAAVAVVPGSAGPAAADEPVPLRWDRLLPPIGARGHHPPPPLPGCRRPSLACVDRAAAGMQARWARWGCDHRAVFAMNYLLLTRVMRDAITTRGFFEEPGHLMREVHLFAETYFAAMDAWERGDLARVPPAWKIALEAWHQGDTSGTQDLLLGINAHVQNDMPFVVAALGLVKPDGTSRKRDHDEGNRVLDASYEPIVEAVAREFDPTTSTFNSPLHDGDDRFGLESVRACARASGATPSGWCRRGPRRGAAASPVRSSGRRPDRRRSWPPSGCPATAHGATRTAPRVTEPGRATLRPRRYWWCSRIPPTTGRPASQRSIRQAPTVRPASMTR